MHPATAATAVPVPDDTSGAEAAVDVRASASLDWLVGERVRTRRARRGWRQQDLADRMRTRAGLPWTRLTVASVERGDREVHLVELAALCGIFGLPVTSFLRPDDGEDTLCADGTEVPWWKVTAEVDGGLRYGWAGLLDTLEADGPIDLLHCATGGAPQIKRATDETDSKAAKVLAQPVQEVQQLARDLWRVPLAEERDRRLAEQERASAAEGEEQVSPRTLQARRGRVTRVLLEEMRQALADPEVRAERVKAHWGGMNAVLVVGGPRNSKTTGLSPGT